MSKKETTEEKIANLLLKLSTYGKVEKINMTKVQHDMMESLVVVYMIAASTGSEPKYFVELDGIWDSIINIT